MDQLSEYKVYRFNGDLMNNNAPWRLLPGDIVDLSADMGINDLCIIIDSVRHQEAISKKVPLRWKIYVDNTPMRSGVIPFEHWARG